MAKHTHWRTPSDVLREAEIVMLDGHEPSNTFDWEQVLHYVASSVHQDTAQAVCHLMVTLYQMPVERRMVDSIVKYQLAQR